MEATEKITVLLADEDALRRDGLAAVLDGTTAFEIVAKCPDGEAAMDRIRELRPDVAVVDLNLPRLHGIELVRRIRGEALGTKVVILASTTDDDIIREVVRAGADAYLLKNGPARHLVDAINYVRDGGQYFSPQLKRDGRDRHLLEEPPRIPPAATPVYRDPEPDPEDQEERPQAEGRAARSSRSRRAAPPPQRFRERLREESGTGNLADRDYEILDLMADGIKPILDRLEDIETRVVQMESGEEPVPSDVQSWLSTQFADTFRDPRGGPKDVALGRSVKDLETRLPQMIEQAVTARFHSMADKLQREIEDTHVRTLETFVKNIQVKLVQRVSALETDMAKQADAMHQLREYSQRTEDNLSRLISGVDKLAQELPKRLQAPEFQAQQQASASASEPKRVRRSGSSFSPKMFWAAVAAVLVIGTAVVEVPKLLHSSAPSASNDGQSSASGTVPAAEKPAPPGKGADTPTKIVAAQQYADRKDYASAEEIYKQVLTAEPNNVDAIKGLASVLYREDKIEESAAILDKLPKQ